MKITEIVSKPTIKDVIAFLLASPKDEIYTRKELGEKFDIPDSTLRHSRSLAKHGVLYGPWYYFGSSEAIKEFKRQINENK